MRNKLMGTILTMAAVLAISPLVRAQSQGDANVAARAGAKNESFDPHNLNGSWLGLKRFFGDDNKVPEPPLTPWGREHLLTRNISHPALSNNDGEPHGSQVSTQNEADPNGVKANVGGGQYPGERCEPIGAPAQFSYTGAYPLSLSCSRTASIRCSRIIANGVFFG